MQIPILSGISSDTNAEFRNAYPVNLIPVPKSTGVSQGYLRPADGVISGAATPGLDRGGICWNSVHYRVLGTSLCRVDADYTVTVLGTILGTDRVTMDFSFDRLAISANGSLYYYAAGAVTKVTDADLGTVFSLVFLGGYFVVTDGENLIVTELVDPTQVDPLKYGSAEGAPDQIQCVHRIANELYVVGRTTLEVMDNIGGGNFPFRRIEGAQIDRGSLGRHCSCVFGTDRIAMLGSGERESPAIWMCAAGSSQRISTREIDTLLQTYTEGELSASVLECRFDRGHQHLYVHLPDRTIVYDAAASAAVEEAVWFTLSSSLDGFARYRARNLVWCHSKWLVGDPTQPLIGELSLSVSSQYGDHVRWEFSTLCVYNDGASGIVHELELVALTGRTAFGVDPYISTSHSKDGITWSQDNPIKVGARGERDKRLIWRQLGTIGHFRMQRFQGDTQSFASFARLEAQIEPLTVATP